MDQEFEKVKEIIADVLNLDTDEIRMDTTFADDLGADSLDLYQILMGIEEEFDIVIPARPITPDTFRSAEALYSVIQSLEDND